MKWGEPASWDKADDPRPAAPANEETRGAGGTAVTTECYNSDNFESRKYMKLAALY